MIPFELIVEEQHGDAGCYRVCWCDGEPDPVYLCNLPEIWLDLIPYMVARRLIRQHNNPERLLIVKLRGADYELMRAPLGMVAASPLLNVDNPVNKPAHCLYRRRELSP
jgi:hypothetical protein